MSKTDDAFDIEAWIAGAERPEDTIRVSSRGKAVAERSRLVKQQKAAQAGQRGRMAAPGDPELQKRIDALDAEIAKGERDFLLRGMDADAAVALQNDHKDAGEKFDEFLIAGCLLSPKMDQPTVHRLRLAVGEGQFRRLARAAASLTFDAEPSTDF